MSLYRTAYCGPNGVCSIEVSLYRTAYGGPNGVLSLEVSLYRAAYSGPNGVLSIEVSLYRTTYSGPNDVLSIEVSLCCFIDEIALSSCYNENCLERVLCVSGLSRLTSGYLGILLHSILGLPVYGDH